MKSIKRFSVIAPVILTLATSVSSAFWTLRLAWADHLSQTDSLPQRQRATQFAPGNVKYWIRLANLQQQYGISAVSAYTQATHSSPLSAEAWMGLGLEYEFAEDYGRAEQCLLHAAHISLEFVPRWTLANYYFRRNDAAHFWPWARQALQIGSGELIPIFRMAWDLNGGADPASHDFLLDRRLVLSQYLSWNIQSKHDSPAESTALRLVRIAEKEDNPVLLYFLNTRLDSGRIEPARLMWNAMIDRKLLDASTLPASEGVVNAEWQTETLNQGFDWRQAQFDGLVFRAETPGLRISFSGRQPEHCEPLSQTVLLQPGEEYQLDYSYQTSHIDRDSGLFWRMVDARDGAELIREPRDLSAEQPAQSFVRFFVPAGCTAGRLILTYRRPAGQTRITGWLRLRQLTLRPVG